MKLVKAKYQEGLEGKRVVCKLCLFECELSSGEFGRCLCRCNIGGTLFSVNYGIITHMDPVPAAELPLQDGPGGYWLKVGGAGCNLRCPYCENCNIAWANPAMLPVFHRLLSPGELVEQARVKGCGGICFSYTEPLVMVEYILDLFEEALRCGMSTAVHTNGTFTPCVVDDLVEVCQHFIIDFKGHSKETFKRISGSCWCSTKVMETTEAIYRKGGHVELVTVVVPGYNDSVFEFRAMARWIRFALSPQVVWHIFPYRPNCQLYHLPPTPRETLERLADIAGEEGLSRVVLHG